MFMVLDPQCGKLTVVICVRSSGSEICGTLTLEQSGPAGVLHSRLTSKDETQRVAPSLSVRTRLDEFGPLESSSEG